MTILIDNLKFSILEELLRKSEDISEMELDIVIQVCIHVLSGARKKEEILNNFERPAKKLLDKDLYHKIIDEYKIIKNIINNI
jgi:hypothetical protein